MKQLTCEMCGSTELIKQDGVFVCQSCGTKYSVEEAKKMMIEGAVDVSGSTVSIDNTKRLDNLLQLARRSRDDNNDKEAAEYYNQILLDDPNNWEAVFYSNYLAASSTTVGNAVSTLTSLKNCLNTVFSLIDKIPDDEERQTAIKEVISKTNILGTLIWSAESNRYNNQSISAKLSEIVWKPFVSRVHAATLLQYELGDQIENHYAETKAYEKEMISAWRDGIDQSNYSSIAGSYISNVSSLRAHYMEKVKKFNPDEFEANPRNSVPPAGSGGGCYIATAIYGSYNCPQVWTLRRFRDYKLAKTWYGRTFIRTYYTISPSLVKCFGRSIWFQKTWRRILDRMVERLKAEGYESSPYSDRTW